MSNIVEREQAIGLFDELVCRGGGTVHLVSGRDPRLVVVGPADLVDRVVVRYRGMRLVIAFRVGPDPVAMVQGMTDQLRVIVSTDAVSRIVSQGFVTLLLGEEETRPLTVRSLRIVNSGSGRISGYVSAETLALRVRGIGGVALGGDALRLDARLSGIGSVDCGDLVCRDARVAVTSLGSATVMALNELAATVTGAGSLSYRGSARLTRRGSQPGHIRYLE